MLIVLAAAGCTGESLVGQGSVNGRDWKVVAYQQDDEVCLKAEGSGANCHVIRDDRRTATSGISLNDGVWIVSGIVRPEVGRVHVVAGDASADLATVPVPFRSDMRAFAGAFATDEMPRITDIWDAQGNPLEDQL